MVGAMAVGISTEGRERIVRGIDGYRNELYDSIKRGFLLFVFFKAGLQHTHIITQQRTNGRAGGKEKVYYHHLAAEIIIQRNLFTQLVSEGDISNLVVYGVLHCISSLFMAIHMVYSVMPGHLYFAFGQHADQKKTK